MKIALAIMVCSCLALMATPANSDEIHLKDGRVIKARVSWNAGDLVKYEKFGAVMGVNQNQVSYIITRFTQKHSDSTVYMDDGGDMFCKLILQQENNVSGIDCIGRESNTVLDSKRVLAVLEGPKSSHRFLDLPEQIQRRWGAATVYLHSGEVLRAKKIQRLGDSLICITHDDRYDVKLSDVKDIGKGHHQMSGGYGDGASKTGQRLLVGRKEKLKQLETDVEKMLMEQQNRLGSTDSGADWVEFTKP